VQEVENKRSQKLFAIQSDVKIQRYLPFLAGFILLLNLIFKAWFLDSQPIAGDEPFSIYMAGMTPSEIVAHLMTGNNPPLWELLLHYWTNVFGIGPFSVRFMPLLFSSFTAVVIFRIGTDFWHWRIGLLAALLFTFSDYHVFFSHEARSYPLFGLLTSISMWRFLGLIALGSRTWPHIVLFSLVNMLLIYTHFLGFWVLFVQSLVVAGLLSRSATKARGIDGAIGLVISLLGYLPYAPVFLHRFRDSATHGTWVPQPDGLDGLYTMLWNFSNQPLVTVVCIILIVVGLGHLAWKREKRLSQAGTIVLVWFFVPFLLMFGLSYMVPMWLDRYLIFVSPAYYLMVALMADRLFFTPKSFALPATVLLVLFAASVHPDVSNKRDVRGAVTKIRDLRKLYPNAPIYMCPNWTDITFLYYWNPICFRHESNIYEIETKTLQCLRDDGVFPIENANSLMLAGVTDVIYFDAAADFSNANNGILTHLKATFTNCEQFHYPEVFNIYYCSHPDTIAVFPGQ
jgi:mannosyltransferase